MCILKKKFIYACGLQFDKGPTLACMYRHSDLKASQLGLIPVCTFLTKLNGLMVTDVTGKYTDLAKFTVSIRLTYQCVLYMVKR